MGISCGRPAPGSEIWEGEKKRPKFGAISDNFRLRSRISLEWINKSQIGNAFDQLQPFLSLSTLGEKIT